MDTCKNYEPIYTLLLNKNEYITKVCVCVCIDKQNCNLADIDMECNFHKQKKASGGTDRDRMILSLTASAPIKNTFGRN